ncbi:hypothetical protein [Burkholderia sp. WSM2232]|uniref:hypothetical protein n=1 Tax=Burkholderia sp. WSM2232 TaxID=944436 RepID=UPI0004113783|nr:hypothetical protein [Burkholderia sp. WSM2232]
MQVDVELHDGQEYRYVGASELKDEDAKWVIIGDAGITMAEFEKDNVKSITTQ